MQYTVLNVEGMTCGLCVSIIEEIFSEFGIQVIVELKTGRVVMKDDEENLPLEKIKAAIEAQGYKVV